MMLHPVGLAGLTDQVVYQSVEDRDGMPHSGMEAGASESMDRFAELLASQLGMKSR
jgi:hypothetical protein